MPQGQARCPAAGPGRYRVRVNDLPEPPWIDVDAVRVTRPEEGSGSSEHTAARSSTHRKDVSLGRQLDAGAVPSSRSAAWMWMLYAALGFLGGQVLAAVTVGIGGLLAGQFDALSKLSKLSEPPTWFVISTLFGLWGGFLGAALLATRLKGTKHFRDDFRLRFRWIDLIGIPIGVAGQYFVALVYVPIAPHIHNFHERFSAPAQRLTGSSHGIGYFVIGLATVVGAPFFEELFFRGIILRALARIFGRLGGVGPVLAVVLSGLLFGLAHAESLQLLGLAIFGIILGVVSYRTGRLGMNIVAHASFNLLALTAVAFPTLLGTSGWA